MQLMQICISMFLVCVKLSGPHIQLHQTARFCSTEHRLFKITNHETYIKRKERKDQGVLFVVQPLYTLLLEPGQCQHRRKTICMVDNSCCSSVLICAQQKEA